ncbi:MAG: hypothetical protein EA421_15055 [Gemmatimonadales bacterium]|nr:MAG: hypothetical protein EA421_15055 [Gemmatimonadales bacterium]
MATQTLNVPDPQPGEASSPLYRHSQKPEWGLALLAWERNGRRAYQFEDGNLRKFQEGYYDLLDPVEEVDDSVSAVRANLQAAVRARRDGSEQKVQQAVCTFEQQVALFTKLYPKGFADPQWKADKRGSVSGSALKRHREPSLVAMKEALDPSRAGGHIEEGSHEELTESILDVLAGTDLVPLSHVKNLRRLDEEESREYAEAAFHLAHGEGSFDERFRAYLAVLARLLGGRPSWRVATALPALLFPREEVAVRRSAFVRQAGSIAPTGNYSRKARATSYRNFRRMARKVRDRLEGAGHEPADLLDVHDFIWTTLRKSALDHF